METTLHQLSAQPESLRDQKWEALFLKKLAEGHVIVEASTPKTGVDGWPYLFVKTASHAEEPTTRVMEWLTEHGVGLLVNGHKDVPDYVLTYGMIWNFKQRGEFLTASPEVENQQVQFQSGQKIWTLKPDLEYLPHYVRHILTEFFADQGVNNPRINLVSVDQEHYDLCFSLESLGGPPAEEHQGIAEAISWFLPAHYSVLLVSEKLIPNFQPLRMASA